MQLTERPGFDSQKMQALFSSPLRLDQFWGPCNLVFSEYTTLVSGSKLTRAWSWPYCWGSECAVAVPPLPWRVFIASCLFNHRGNSIFILYKVLSIFNSEVPQPHTPASELVFGLNPSAYQTNLSPFTFIATLQDYAKYFVKWIDWYCSESTNITGSLFISRATFACP